MATNETVPFLPPPIPGIGTRPGDPDPLPWQTPSTWGPFAPSGGTFPAGRHPLPWQRPPGYVPSPDFNPNPAPGFSPTGERISNPNSDWITFADQGYPTSPIPYTPPGAGNPNAPGSNLANLPAGVDRNAFAFLNSVLNQYGLGELGSWVIGELVNGVPQEQVVLDMYNTKAFHDRFPAIFMRQAAGLPPISPTDYLGLEDAYTQILHNAGMPRGFFDDKQSLTNFIAGDVSPTEFKSRIDQGFQAVEQAPMEVKHAFTRFYGPSGDAALASYILDSKIATPILLQHIQAAEIAGTGAEFGFGGLSQGLAERAAQQGVTTGTAANAFQKGATDYQELLHGAISDNHPFGSEATAAGLLGTSPGAQFALQHAVAAEQAPFEGSGGAQQTNTGITGLGKAQSI